MSSNIVKMNILISPFKVMNYTFISQLLFYNEYILEKVNYSLLDVKMIKFCNHSFLVFKIFFILIYQSISFVNYVSYIIKNCAISANI